MCCVRVCVSFGMKTPARGSHSLVRCCCCREEETMTASQISVTARNTCKERWAVVCRSISPSHRSLLGRLRGKRYHRKEEEEEKCQKKDTHREFLTGFLHLLQGERCSQHEIAACACTNVLSPHGAFWGRLFGGSRGDFSFIPLLEEKR